MAEALFDDLEYRQAPPMQLPPPLIPTLEVAVERILDVYSRATEDHIREGTKWYDDAHAIAVDMWVRYPKKLNSVAHAAGILAAFSPIESWERNIEKAWMFLDTGDCGALSRSKDEALLITYGFDPLDILFRGGRNFKVQSFYRNIADPTDPNPVTVDRHAKAIVYDDSSIVYKRPGAPTQVEYEHYAEAYRKAAKEVDKVPSQLQAVTWLAWRENFRPRDVQLPF